jgi:DNA polymerase III psi subunit
MLSDHQHAYLEAMGITVWNLRETVTPEAHATVNFARLKLGPGSDGILLVCDADSDSAGRLANDINRTLGGTPVWAWPDGDEDAPDIGSAIEENLFTTVAFFGKGVAAKFFDGEPPAHFKTANMVLLPSMGDIQRSANARRELWASFCRSGMLENG